MELGARRRDRRNRRLIVRRRLLAGVLAVAMALAASVAWAAAGGTGGTTGGNGPTGQTGPAGSIVPRLTTAQLAGQLIIYSYAGLRPPRGLIARIRAGDAAGVIFFADNVTSARQLAGVAAELQQASASSPIHVPLLLMTDQEGGLVRRLPGAPRRSEKQIGQSAVGAMLAAQAGAGAAANLRSAGLNVNLAPVLDVYRQAGSFIDRYERSYSSDPAVVTSLGAAFIAAQQTGGVAATAKHFPGLGAAAAGQDTDAGPVTLDVSARTLRTIDEAPYVGAIGAGVKLVMVSWAVYPTFGTTLPAGLSRAVIQGELRGRLGFSGVTITDAIGAGALDGYGGIGRRALLAAEAGADLILCSGVNANGNGPALGGQAFASLRRSLESGALDRSTAETAAGRVLGLRAALAG